jgi:hypothetical protein
MQAYSPEHQPPKPYNVILDHATGLGWAFPLVWLLGGARRRADRCRRRRGSPSSAPARRSVTIPALGRCGVCSAAARDAAERRLPNLEVTADSVSGGGYMAKKHGSSVKNDKKYEALRDKGYSKARSAKIANSGKSASRKGGKHSH